MKCLKCKQKFTSEDPREKICGMCFSEIIKQHPILNPVRVRGKKFVKPDKIK